MTVGLMASFTHQTSTQSPEMKRVLEIAKTNQPAFPTGFDFQDGSTFQCHGMTLRDWFAGQALGFGFDWSAVHETGGYAEAAQVAYEVADAMMAAREK